MKKNQKAALKPRHEAFLPMLLATVCMVIAFLSMIIDRFIFSFGGELLSPAIAQLIILLLPAYLCLLFTSAHKSFYQQMTGIGMGRIKADCIFLVIFASTFMISTSLLLNIVFGGVYAAADGFSLLGGFVAGKNEYAVSYPYLIVVYALIPALCEEFVFRGLVFSELSRVNETFATVTSSLISACFAFSLGGLPAAFLCGVTYCFVLHTTRSLQACMIIHFIVNLFGLFVGTNIYRYFLSSQNNALLIIVLVLACLISCSLFFAEVCKIYRKRAAEISKNTLSKTLPDVDPQKLWNDMRSAVLFKPTLTVSIIFIVFYFATMVIQYFI